MIEKIGEFIDHLDVYSACLKYLRMKNGEIRAWYQERVVGISKLNEEWIARGISLEERALRAWRIRHDARIEARSMMEDTAEIEDLRERDRRLYGNPDGPTFDQLVEENYRGGLQRNEVYERIIRGSQTTNREVNKLLDLKGPSE
jgi:hypothetical protein